MFDKPSRMLQRKFIARFYSGSFDAVKGIDVLISQIDDSQVKINSMGKSPSLEAILSKVDALKVWVSTAKEDNATGRAASLIFWAAFASPLATRRRAFNAPKTIMAPGLR